MSLSSTLPISTFAFYCPYSQCPAMWKATQETEIGRWGLGLSGTVDLRCFLTLHLLNRLDPSQPCYTWNEEEVTADRQTPITKLVPSICTVRYHCQDIERKTRLTALETCTSIHNKHTVTCPSVRDTSVWYTSTVLGTHEHASSIMPIVYSGSAKPRCASTVIPILCVCVWWCAIQSVALI